MGAEWVDISAAGGARFRAHMSLPETRRGPGLVLLQEIFGVNAHIQEKAREFAEHGFVVLAPDLYWRMTPGLELDYSEHDLAIALDHYAKLDLAHAMSDIQAAVNFLRDRKECTGRVAAIGYCLGGYLAFRSALECNIQAAVSYYGVGVERHLDEAGDITAPVMLHYAEDDKFIPASTVDEIVRGLAGRAFVKVFSYSGVDHAFANKDRSTFDNESTTLSETRTLEFLRNELVE